MGTQKLNALDQLLVTVQMQLHVRDLAAAIALNADWNGEDLKPTEAVRLIRQTAAMYGGLINQRWVARLDRLRKVDTQAAEAWAERWTVAVGIVERLFR